MPNSAIAKQRALFNCNLRAKNSTTCRVVNLDGLFINYSDYSKSSDPAFSAFGNLDDLTGRYKIEARSTEWLYDGVLNLKVDNPSIEGTVKFCIEDEDCGVWSIEKIHETERGRYFRVDLTRTHSGRFGLRLWPKTMQLRVSFSSQTSTIKGKIGGEIGGLVFNGVRTSE